MIRLLILQFVIIPIFLNALSAQIIPKNHDTLNYRLVGFSFPANKNATAYQLELYSNSATTDKNTKADKAGMLIFSKQYTENQVIETVPEFNKSYKWRVLYKKKNTFIDSSDYFFFRTGYSVTIDSSKYRIKIIKNSLGNDNQLFILDFISVMYGTDGQPLWYLPDIPLVTDKNIQIRDLKPTIDGTFTAVSSIGAYEFDYNGNVIWRAPNNGKISGDTSEFYHHEFTKLSSRNYMVCGRENAIRKIPSFDHIKIDTLINRGTIIKNNDGGYSINITAGTLIEYDSNGNIVWHWKSSVHCSDSDFFRKSRRPSGVNTDMHLNSFWFDETNKFIYLSFRNTNEIMKIEYPAGTIIARYNGVSPNGGNLYLGQHSIRKTADGKLYLFNNNLKMADFSNDLNYKNQQTSYITILEETTGPDAHLKKLWEYSCDIDTFALPGAGVGGSVEMLPDNSILASMGAAGRIFIVTQDKRLLYNSVPQAKDENGKWGFIGQYRTSSLRKEELKKFIFKSNYNNK